MLVLEPYELSLVVMTKKVYFLYKISFIILIFQCSSFTRQPTRTSPEETLAFETWAGIQDNMLEPKHKTEMDNSWSVMLERKNKIETFLTSKSYDSSHGTVVYPFSGIDVLNLFTFFPKSKRYILFGLEDPGYPFEWKQKSDIDKKTILHGIGSLSSHLAGRYYFTYRKMKEETKKPALSGAYPVFVAFLRRLGKEIIDSREEVIKGPSETYRGFTLVLYDSRLKQEQTFTYFKIFLTGKEGLPGDGIYEYFKGLGEISVFTKSAEYLFHGERRSLFRTLLLSNASQVVQDDSGFPLRLFPENEWNRTLYGRYEKSWKLSGAVEPEFQSDMIRLNAELNNEPLPFPFGYGVLGSKTVSQSLILVMKKKPD